MVWYPVAENLDTMCYCDGDRRAAMALTSVVKNHDTMWYYNGCCHGTRQASSTSSWTPASR